VRYQRVSLAAIGYELGPVVVGTDELEARLAPLYTRLRIPMGQLEALTGVSERRWWKPGFTPSAAAAMAAHKALADAGLAGADLDAVIYAGVCREHFEPATACAVAAAIGAAPTAWVYDVSNACLGMLNAIVDAANRIELGQIRRALIVAAESARDIVDEMIDRMLCDGGMELFKSAAATLTGGSGSAALVLRESGEAPGRPRLRGVAVRTAPQHHPLSVWGIDGERGHQAPFMSIDAAATLKHGVELAAETWEEFLSTMGWQPGEVERVICHQVGTPHRDAVLSRLRIPAVNDFSTHNYLGNMGTVALPIAARIAEERGFVRPGDNVGFLGIGSGLNCLMMGWQW
jgi:3-oxoacyl-[acyl-carrier-protein] synthase III